MTVFEKWALLAAFSLLLAGCETTPRSPAPLTTVTVPEEIAIAPAAPLVAPPETASPPTAPALSQPASSVPPQVSPSKPVWPTNWVNAWIPLDDWATYNGLTKPIQIGSRPSPSYELRGSNGVAAIRMNSRIALWNGLECWLGFAPQFIKGRPCIHWLDVQKTLQPLVSPPSFHFNGNRTVVLDAGHGGKDSGTRSVVAPAYEKDYALDWALRLRPLLMTNGWRVLLTRSNDQDLSLPQRVAVADRSNADLFLSLHFNSGLANGGLAGVETYCLTPVGLPSNLLRDYEDNVQQPFPNNAFDEQNFQLASRLHRSVVQSASAPDRGVRRARFMGVLRTQNRPAVLIEAGYLSNAVEARKIASADYREKLAEAVARALQ